MTFGQTNLLTNIPNRDVMSLNGPWHYIIDPYETGFYNYRYEPYDKQSPISGGFMLDAQAETPQELIEYNFEKSPVLQVPGDWNSQSDVLTYYEGTIWYERKFDVDLNNIPAHIFLYFGAINYESHVYLNGQKLGKHIGGFTPFNYEVTPLLKAQNSIVIKVDNKRYKEAVPTINTDWWNYGGITRDVLLIFEEETYVEDYSFNFRNEEISGTINFAGTELLSAPKIEIPELKQSTLAKKNAAGQWTFTLSGKKAELWTPENPKLYAINISFDKNNFADQIGLRTIKTNGSKVELNGQSIFLKGICIHEENPLTGGRVARPEEAKMLLTWAKELGCNYVRLAHYPHNEHMVRMAEKMGLLVWSEIPVYWTIDWSNPNTLANAKNQLTTMITRDRNRANVIIWSMANETPPGPQRNAFLGELVKTARALDGSRLISAALEIHTKKDDPNTITMNDPFVDQVDIISFNQYIGWYWKTIDDCKSIKWDITQNKPVLISEFGAGALQSNHGSAQHRWTEEFQAKLYSETLPMLERIPQFAGVSPWILVDFKSPKRNLPGIQDGWNRKGLIGSNGIKKQAYLVLQSYYLNK